MNEYISIQYYKQTKSGKQQNAMKWYPKTTTDCQKGNEEADLTMILSYIKAETKEEPKKMFLKRNRTDTKMKYKTQMNDLVEKNPFSSGRQCLYLHPKKLNANKH